MARGFNGSFVENEGYSWDHKCQTQIAYQDGTTDFYELGTSGPELVLRLSNFAISRDFQLNAFVSGTAIASLLRKGQEHQTILKTARLNFHSQAFESYPVDIIGTRIVFNSDNSFAGGVTDNYGKLLSVQGDSVLSFDMDQTNSGSIYPSFVKIQISENWNMTTYISEDAIQGTCVEVLAIPWYNRILAGVLLINGSIGSIIAVLYLTARKINCLDPGDNMDEGVKGESNNLPFTTLAEGVASKKPSAVLVTSANPTRSLEAD